MHIVEYSTKIANKFDFILHITLKSDILSLSKVLLSATQLLILIAKANKLCSTLYILSEMQNVVYCYRRCVFVCCECVCVCVWGGDGYVCVFACVIVFFWYTTRKRLKMRRFFTKLQAVQNSIS